MVSGKAQGAKKISKSPTNKREDGCLEERGGNPGEEKQPGKCGSHPEPREHAQKRPLRVFSMRALGVAGGGEWCCVDSKPQSTPERVLSWGVPQTASKGAVRQ